MVYRSPGPEHHQTNQQSWNGIGIGDGAWGEHGAGGIHKQGKKEANWMRGDTVGVGDVGQVHVRVW